MNKNYSLQNFNLYIDGQKILSDQSFSIGSQEIVGLIGLSGSGKTQTLKSLAGLNLQSDSSLRKNTVYISAEDNLFSWLTVYENLSLFTEDHDKINQVLEKLELTHHRNFYPHQLSSGLKHRASFARVFVQNAELVLIDEAFAKLDEIRRQELLKDFLKTISQNNLTALIVSHDYEDLLNYCHKIYFQSAKSKKITNELIVNPSNKINDIEKIKQWMKNDYLEINSIK